MNDFDVLPFLVNGEGPYNGTTRVTGQLAPWPGIVAPITTGGSRWMRRLRKVMSTAAPL